MLFIHLRWPCGQCQQVIFYYGGFFFSLGRKCEILKIQNSTADLVEMKKKVHDLSGGLCLNCSIPFRCIKNTSHNQNPKFCNESPEWNKYNFQVGAVSFHS